MGINWNKAMPQHTHYCLARKGFINDSESEPCHACIPRPTKPEWDGTGYPPIGCECEVYHYEDWRRCEILAHRDRLVLYYVPGFIRQQTGSTSGQWFRPIRTKEKNERDELMGIIGKAWSHDRVGACADAILEKYHLTERD